MSRSSNRSRLSACTRSPFTCIPRSRRKSPSTSRAPLSRPNGRRRAKTSRCANRPRWTTSASKSARRWPRPGRTPASTSRKAARLPTARKFARATKVSRSASGGVLCANATDRPAGLNWASEAPLDPLDLVRGNADRKAGPVPVVASAHDLGVFVEPMQPLPVAGVELQFEFRPAASQAILNRDQKVVEPFPCRRGNGERRSLSRFVLLSERGARVGVQQVDLVPGLNDTIGVIGDANLVQNRLDIMGLRVAVRVGNVAHVHNDIGCPHLFERRAKGGNE